MKCDVILYADKEVKKISKEESSQELDSIRDILKFLYNDLGSRGLQKLLRNLDLSRALVPKKSLFFKGKQIIGNCSKQLLMELYPEQTELLKHIDPDRAFNITLIDRAYVNGQAFKGRVITSDGIVTYVLRNKYDVENFTKLEYKKFLVSKTIEGNEIKDEYLKEKYKDILNFLRNHYKKNILNISGEVDPNFIKDSEFTINYLVMDYLNNTSLYKDILEYKGEKLDSNSILRDFCRELNKLEVFNEDTESELVKSLKNIDYKLNKFGKLSFYNTLITYFPKLKEKYSKQLFIELNESDMENLLLEIFKDDIILNQYHVKRVDVTNDEEINIPKVKIKTLFKDTLKIVNELRKKDNLLEISDDIDKVLTSKEEALDFFKDNLFIEIDGVKYPITVKEHGKQLRYYYVNKKISDDSLILLERERKTLQDLLGANLDTLQVFEPVNEDEVNDGFYLGYYIYKTKDSVKQEPIYIISQSIICPQLYDLKRFKSLRDAKLAIRSFNRSSTIERGSNININIDVLHIDGSRYTIIPHLISSGLTISSLYFPINPRTRLLTLEFLLFKNGKISDIVDRYKKFNIDLSALTIPELFGIFLHAMTNKGYVIDSMLKEPLTLELLDDIKINIIDKILKAERVQYLVERNTENFYFNSKGEKIKNGYIVYLKDLTNSGRIINSSGLDNNNETPDTSLSATLWNLKNSLESTLFKDTGVTIEITNKEDLEQMKDSLGNPLFPDGVSEIKGFVHNNSIYLNQSSCNINDMIHETFHILLGAIKVKDFNTYKDIIDSLLKKAPKSIKNKVEEVYSKLAYMDQLEEIVVRYLARVIENNNSFLYENKTDNAVKFLLKLFEDMKASIKENIKKDFNTDLGFDTILNTLVKENLSEMKLNRIVTNLIQEGIDKKTIIEDCKK